jgi:hypothetical protein
MSHGNEVLVREAYEAYGRGDVDRMLTAGGPAARGLRKRPDPLPPSRHGALVRAVARDPATASTYRASAAPEGS